MCEAPYIWLKLQGDNGPENVETTEAVSSLEW